MSYRILIIDDEIDILEFVGYNLRKEGYQVHTATNGREGVERALEVVPHLILLDVMMPEMDGVEACQEIRLHPELLKTMIVFLTARGEDYSQIAGFDAGADDYIAKPIRMKVLISRIKAMFNRMETIHHGAGKKETERSIVIDHERHLVVKGEVEIVMPRKEFALLSLLFSKPQKVFTREEIFSNVWGDDVIVGDRTIDVHIRKLREKIGDQHIVTVKGVGYKYED